MISWWHNSVLMNRIGERRTQEFHSIKYPAIYGLLVLAILISAAIAYGQAGTSGKSATVSGDSSKVVELDRKTVWASGASQTAMRQPSLRRENPFAYQSRGRRDAFRALISDSRKEEKVATDLLCLDDAVLTGVVWSSGEYLAMVRDKDGKNFFLREGDAVFRGRVMTVTQTKAVFRLVEFGEVERITLTVRSNEGNK